MLACPRGTRNRWRGCRLLPGVPLDRLLLRPHLELVGGEPERAVQGQGVGEWIPPRDVSDDLGGNRARCVCSVSSVLVRHIGLNLDDSVARSKRDARHWGGCSALVPNPWLGCHPCRATRS